MSANQDLARLIATYKWLLGERDSQRGLNAAANARHIDAALDDVFLRIARFPAEDPRISCHQIEFLLAVLSEDGADQASRALVCEAVLDHVKRLAARVPAEASGRRASSAVGKASGHC